MTTTSYVHVGDNVSVPIHTEVPGSWNVRLKCDVLGPQTRQ
jgi:hypothetical protein